MYARRSIAEFWDSHVNAWLAGNDPLDSPLDDWFAAYRGTGRGAVTRQGFVEPYQGDLIGLSHEPRAVVLALNPGIFLPELQARDGQFAEEIRAAGSYSAWVRNHPYDNTSWLTYRGPNSFYRARLTFTQRWLRDPDACHNDMLLFELYPWHSTGVTAPIRPRADIIKTFVWDPIAEIATDYVFAFGRPWQHLAEVELGLSALACLGAGGDPYGSTVAGRAVRVYALPSGQRLVVEWHPGSAGPPNADEVEVLRDAMACI